MKRHSFLVIVLCAGGLAGAPAAADFLTSGPDVIVGDLYDLAHWGSSGGIHAYSVGTISCNIGDEPLYWQSWSSLRPVIGQTMYRLKAGRFEQLGQSWLKWAFLALNQDFCGDCIYPGSGSLLGVNCSDPYSASLNGSQSSLGPKSVVNPFTGELPATHAFPGSGVIDGRLQVFTIDVDPLSNPGALYFVEGQYVSPDDAAAGNLHNNASWRQIWVESDLDVTFTRPVGGGSSATVRMQPVIEAWRAFDPNVGLTIVDIPDEGRVYVAWKATELGDGSWNYEFAVQNLNSDRAVGGFIVHLPDGAGLTNIGFHDVAYHSGEPYSGTDWTPTTGADYVRWDTLTYAEDPNANALRWGTLYNFRFRGPMDPSLITEAELVLFKPGTPESVVVPLPRPTDNDGCATPALITDGAYYFDNTTADSDGPAEPGCGFDGVEDADLWYEYVATCTGTLTVSLCGSSFDTALAVYPAGCPGGSGTALACNDNGCGAQSELTLAVEEGTALLIRVGGPAVGTGTLQVSCAPTAVLANDDCDSAEVVDVGVTFFDTTAATPSAPEDASCAGFTGTDDADIWFQFTAPCAGDVAVSLCGSSFDTRLAVYTQCPDGPGTALACNDNDCGAQSQVTFGATSGAAYLVRVGGAAGARGPGLLSIECADSACPNDSVASAVAIAELPFTHEGSTSSCRDDFDEECPFQGSTAPDVVHTYWAPRDQVIDISLCGSAYDTKVYVYEDAITAGEPLACNDDGCVGAPPESYRSYLAELALTAHRTYTIVVDGWGSSDGSYTLEVLDQSPHPVGDLNCDGAVNAFDIDAFVLAVTDAAGYEVSYPDCDVYLADCNEDGVVNAFDIDPFVGLLTR